MLKRFYRSLIIVAVILTLGGYETYACVVQGKEPFWYYWYTPPHSQKKLDLEIDYAGYYNKAVDGNPNAGCWKQRDLTTQKFFNFNDVKPGDSGEGTIGLHLKNQNAWVCAIIRPIENDDSSSTEPELLEDEMDNSADKWDGELAQNLVFSIWADTCSKNGAKPGDNIYQESCDRLLIDGIPPSISGGSIRLALADSDNLNIFNERNEPLKKNRDYYIGVEWKLPDSVGNIAQTDSYKADITFYAEQSDGNLNFRCADIYKDDPVECKKGELQKCYSGDSGTKNVGVCRAGFRTCIWGSWSACAGEIIPGQEICGDRLDNDCDGQTDENCPPPCRKAADCNDYDSKTDDQCVNKKCANENKNYPHRQ